jgi:hypothetical protein
VESFSACMHMGKFPVYWTKYQSIKTYKVSIFSAVLSPKHLSHLLNQAYLCFIMLLSKVFGRVLKIKCPLMTIEGGKKLENFNCLHTNVENNLSTFRRDAFHWHSQRLSFLEISKRLFLHFTEKNPNLLLSLSDQKTKNSKSLKGFQSLPVL